MTDFSWYEQQIALYQGRLDALQHDTTWKNTKQFWEKEIIEYRIELRDLKLMEIIDIINTDAIKAKL